MSFLKRKINTEITRFVSGECTPEEKRAISVLIDSDKEYKEVYEELSKVWECSSSLLTEASFDVDAAWSNVASRTSKEPQKSIHPVIHLKSASQRIAGYALRVAAVLIIGLAVYQLLIPQNSQQSFSSGKTMASPLSLVDGSVVYLNSSSEIKFPKKFGGDVREVYFWGEAFFEIAHDPTRPFIIETGETRIKVLGTSFNVKAYPGTDRIEVVVNSGKVLFYLVDKSDHILKQVVLQKGDKGVYNRKSGQIARLLNDEPNYLSWKTGMLIFNETSFDKVLSEVGQKYGVTFNLAEKDLSQLKLTATFDNESLDSVLEVLQLVHNLQFVNNGKDYLVKKKAG